jgi:DNA-binding CsgD family transcriptional regulator
MQDTTESHVDIILIDDPDEVPPPFPELTPREREIALLMARGDSPAEIAKGLGMSVKTYDTHRGHLLKKLGCRHNVDLARLAVRRGYLTA